jgi:hypothetical protein
MLSDRSGLTADNRAHFSSPKLGQKWFDTEDAHYAREVVGEHVQRHLSRHFGQRLHQKVRRPHPHFQRAKRMLDRLATSTHCIWISVQARLNSIDNILVLPPLDATLRSLRALSLQRAGAARVGPVAVKDQSIFLVREVVGQLFRRSPQPRSGNPACRSGLPTSPPTSGVLAA